MNFLKIVCLFLVAVSVKSSCTNTLNAATQPQAAETKSQAAEAPGSSDEKRTGVAIPPVQSRPQRDEREEKALTEFLTTNKEVYTNTQIPPVPAQLFLDNPTLRAGITGFSGKTGKVVTLTPEAAHELAIKIKEENIVNLSELIAKPTILVTNGEDDFVPRSISTKDLILSSEMLFNMLLSGPGQEYTIKSEPDEQAIVQITRHPESKKIMLVLKFDTQTLNDLLDVMAQFRFMIEKDTYYLNYYEFEKRTYCRQELARKIFDNFDSDLSIDIRIHGYKVPTSRSNNLLLAADYLQMPDITAAIIQAYTTSFFLNLDLRIGRDTDPESIKTKIKEYITMFINKYFPLLSTHLIDIFKRHLAYYHATTSSDQTSSYSILKQVAEEACNPIDISLTELSEDCFINPTYIQNGIKTAAHAYLEQTYGNLNYFRESSVFSNHALIKAITEQIGYYVNQLTPEKIINPDFDFIAWFDKLPVNLSLRNKIMDKVMTLAQSFLDRYPFTNPANNEAEVVFNQNQLIDLKANFATLPEGIFKNNIRFLNYKRRIGGYWKENPNIYAEPLDSLEENLARIINICNPHWDKFPCLYRIYKSVTLSEALDNPLALSNNTLDLSNLNITLSALNGLLDLHIIAKTISYKALPITTLKLNNNRLIKIPRKIFTLFPDLKELDISGTQIKSIEGIEAFKKLEKLNVSNNQLEDIFPVCELKKLTTLDIRNNPHLQKLPWELADLEHLTVKHFDRHLRWPSKAVILWTPPAGLSSSSSAEVKETKEEKESTPEDPRLGPISSTNWDNLGQPSTAQPASATPGTSSSSLSLDETR